MSGTYAFTVGDRGRVVLPAELRQSRSWPDGTKLFAMETEQGVLITTSDELLAIIRAQFTGAPSMAVELVQERREAARHEDSA